MSDTERTQHMTDAEVLADLKAQRRRPPAPRKPDWGDTLMYVFGLLGILLVLYFIWTAGGGHP